MRPGGAHGAATSPPEQDMSTNLEALERCRSGIFTKASSHSHDRPVLTLWRVRVGGLKAPSSQPGAGDHPHPEATQSYLVRTKDAPLRKFQGVRNQGRPQGYIRLHHVPCLPRARPCPRVPGPHFCSAQGCTGIPKWARKLASESWPTVPSCETWASRLASLGPVSL